MSPCPKQVLLRGFGIEADGLTKMHLDVAKQLKRLQVMSNSSIQQCSPFKESPERQLVLLAKLLLHSIMIHLYSAGLSSQENFGKACFTMKMESHIRRHRADVITTHADGEAQMGLIHGMGSVQGDLVDSLN